MSVEQLIPIVCSVVSCGCAVFVTLRAGNWRQSDDARQLDTRISKIERDVQACEIRLQDLPTKADVERVRGEVHTVSELVKAAGAGVDRIETFWMQQSNRGVG